MMPWNDALKTRWAGASLVLAAVSAAAWIVFAAKVRAAGGFGGVTEGPWSPGLGVGLSLGVAVLTGVFSAAALVVSSVASMLGRAIGQIERDAAVRRPS
jgi:hypothetical protein